MNGWLWALAGLGAWSVMSLFVALAIGAAIGHPRWCDCGSPPGPHERHYRRSL